MKYKEMIPSPPAELRDDRGLRGRSEGEKDDLVPLADHVVSLETTDGSTFGRFFQFVSDTISAGARAWRDRDAPAPPAPAGGRCCHLESRARRGCLTRSSLTMPSGTVSVPYRRSRGGECGRDESRGWAPADRRRAAPDRPGWGRDRPRWSAGDGDHGGAEESSPPLASKHRPRGPILPQPRSCFSENCRRRRRRTSARSRRAPGRGETIRPRRVGITARPFAAGPATGFGVPSRTGSPKPPPPQAMRTFRARDRFPMPNAMVGKPYDSTIPLSLRKASGLPAGPARRISPWSRQVDGLECLGLKAEVVGNGSGSSASRERP